MTRDQFWTIIEAALAKGRNDLAKRYRSLVEQLTDLPSPEIIDFDGIVDELLIESYRWDLWAAARILNGGCSKDEFQDFRRWLITCGYGVYTAALSNPDSLADVDWITGDNSFEAFGWVTDEAYGISTGRDIRGDRVKATATTVKPTNKGPVGARWEDGDLQRMLPKLYKTFAGDP
jgi:hypothetical protein